MFWEGFCGALFKTSGPGYDHLNALRRRDGGRGAVQEAQPDLLVMGSQGRIGLSRLLMGSTTEKVVREMPCSVMTLKQEHLIRFPLEKDLADIETHFRKGIELLEKQVMEGAVAQFEYCMRKDPFFIPAWEGMAVAYRKMGKKKETERCEEMAVHIREHLWQDELKDSE